VFSGKRFSKRKPAQGCLLLSEPFMLDPNFKRTVVLLAEHNENGTIGFILNRPINVKLNEAVAELPGNGKLYYGGPVGTDQLFFIHTLGDRIDGSMEIRKGIYWGGNFETVKFMLKENLFSEGEIFFFIGYSGWAPKQLEKEMNENSWIVASMKPEYLRNKHFDTLWADVLKGMGKEYSMLSNFPEDPQMN
jgi:putative transcriptional regulator